MANNSSANARNTPAIPPTLAATFVGGGGDGGKVDRLSFSAESAFVTSIKFISFLDKPQSCKSAPRSDVLGAILCPSWPSPDTSDLTALCAIGVLESEMKTA